MSCEAEERKKTDVIRKRAAHLPRLKCVLCLQEFERLYVPTCRRLDHGVCLNCFKVNRTKCTNAMCKGVFRRKTVGEFLKSRTK